MLTSWFRERDFERDAQRVCWNSKSIWWVSWPRRNAASYQPRNLNSSQVFDNFLLYIIREHAVGNPSAIEGQTANILISRTGVERDAQRVCWKSKSIWWVPWPIRNTASYQPRNLNSSQVFDNFLLNIGEILLSKEPQKIIVGLRGLFNFSYSFISFICDSLFVTICFSSDNYPRKNNIPASKMQLRQSKAKKFPRCWFHARMKIESFTIISS